jgi:hypothetical protein
VLSSATKQTVLAFGRAVAPFFRCQFSRYGRKTDNNQTGKYLAAAGDADFVIVRSSLA